MKDYINVQKSHLFNRKTGYAKLYQLIEVSKI